MRFVCYTMALVFSSFQAMEVFVNMLNSQKCCSAKGGFYPRPKQRLAWTAWHWWALWAPETQRDTAHPSEPTGEITSLSCPECLLEKMV